jgi:multidrug efflux pump subunit AcrA (membrane-fusion protein)
MYIDIKKPITAKYKNKLIPLEIVHLSQSGSNNQSYTLTFRTNKESLNNINDGSFIEINLPLHSEEGILIPLDSVHFSTDRAEVYVLDNTKAKLKTITLGEVIGSYIVVTNGLVSGDAIIIDRNVVDGEEIKF